MEERDPMRLGGAKARIEQGSGRNRRSFDRERRSSQQHRRVPFAPLKPFLAT
jgi:hypothetical protein